jgi:hypothetical protein
MIAEFGSCKIAISMQEAFMAKTIVGSFVDYQIADKAVRKLIDDGFVEHDISVCVSGIAEEDHSGAGAGAGAVAVAGGLVGSLTASGVSKEYANYYGESVRRGGALVTVRAGEPRAERATEIMRESGAIDIDQRISRWRESGWTGWDPSAAPYTREEAERERRLYGTHADPLSGLPSTADPERENRRDSTIRR